MPIFAIQNQKNNFDYSKDAVLSLKLGIAAILFMFLSFPLASLFFFIYALVKIAQRITDTKFISLFIFLLVSFVLVVAVIKYQKGGFPLYECLMFYPSYAITLSFSGLRSAKKYHALFGFIVSSLYAFFIIILSGMSGLF